MVKNRTIEKPTKKDIKCSARKMHPFGKISFRSNMKKKEVTNISIEAKGLVIFNPAVGG